MNRKLTDVELSAVCEVISSHTGLNFPIERWATLRRSFVMAAREFGYKNMSGFIDWLLSSNLNKDQIETLSSFLTCSETYFWREPQVFSALTDFILPELIRSQKNGTRSIRIWSAGCSTGEEPYSIAIALHKTIKKIEDWDISILATDINLKAIRKASSGIYNEWSFRNTPASLKNRYFNLMEDRKYEIIPQIKKMVTFNCLSLIEMTPLINVNSIDIIFCRNVLMYFTNEWATRVSQNFFHSLNEDGWLVVSSCELSSQLFSKFSPVNFPGAILYQKIKKDSPHKYIVHSLSSETLARKSLQPFNTSTLQQPQPIEKPPDETHTVRISGIRLLANQGHLTEALSACDKAIELNKLVSGLYLLRASILQELNKSLEAIKSLKQAIYIDPDYIMGHFTLGNLFIRQGNIKDAKRCFNNALKLLDTVADNNIPAESDGLSAEYIRGIILDSLQIQ